MYIERRKYDPKRDKSVDGVAKHGGCIEFPIACLVFASS